MWKNLVSNKVRLSYVAMAFAVAIVASSATAVELAEVGVIHADGRVELDLGRFTSTISTGPGSSMPVGQTLFKISNGFLYILRLAEDGCTSEEFLAFDGYTVGETFGGVQAWMSHGLYGTPSELSLVEPQALERKLVVSLAQFVTCENVSCDGGLCFREDLLDVVTCDCSYFEVVNGILVEDRGNSGCEKRLNLRPWWNLALSVDASYIHTP